MEVRFDIESKLIKAAIEKVVAEQVASQGIAISSKYDAKISFGFAQPGGAELDTWGSSDDLIKVSANLTVFAKG